MSASTVRLLEAASEFLGSEERLAHYLGIGDLLLRAYLEDRRPLPDPLLLRAVDLILDNLQKPVPPARHVARALEESMQELKSRTA